VKLVVLRLGHRKERDKRATTHVCLAARALGANGVVLSGENDPKIVDGVRKVVQNWGGDFRVEYRMDWKKVLKRAKADGFRIVHLTMYGERLQDVVGKIRRKRKLMVVVGSEKVPGIVYSLADYNVAVSNQPHSEIAALAVFLHDFFEGKELGKRFRNAKIAVFPQERGKKVMRNKTMG